MHANKFYAQVKHRGFTLIEIIVGIVVLSVSLSVITTLIYPTVEQSAGQLHQIRAAELGQSMLNEIQNKAFDENSDMAGGRVRCGEHGVTCSNAMGPDIVSGTTKETRVNFNDVDDYHNLPNTIGNINNSQGKSVPLYTGFSMKITVCNDSDYDGDCLSNSNNFTAKLITVTVTTPSGFDIIFSSYRANF